MLVLVPILVLAGTGVLLLYKRCFLLLVVIVAVAGVGLFAAVVAVAGTSVTSAR